MSVTGKIEDLAVGSEGMTCEYYSSGKTEDLAVGSEGMTCERYW